LGTTATAFVVSVGLASYLTMVSTLNTSSTRSLQWNTAMAVAEAGVEEAFAHLNDDAANPTANGWISGQSNSQQIYTKRRDFTNDGSYCLITISNSTVAPVVFSTGKVPGPF